MGFVKRLFVFSFIMFVMNILPMTVSPAFAADEDIKNSEQQQIDVKNPATDLWRAVRNREFDGADAFSSSSQIKSMGAGTLVNTQGQEWRGFRMTKLVPLSMMLLGGVLLALILFRLIRGKIKIKAGRSKRKILRFSGFQRFVHWSVAILFVILAITGTLLTFGRFGLVPLIGNKAFGTIAGFGKLLHDYLGPVFGIMLTLMLFTFIKGNFATWTDVKWIFKAGGLLGGHASAGRYNAGEKLWFWIAILVGAVVVVSGIVLDFPFFDQTRADLELSHMVHAVASIGLLAISFGHIYMGTVGMEGALDPMKTGYCDENWAKEHHDLWYEDLKAQGLLKSSTTAAVRKVKVSAKRKDSDTNINKSDTDASSPQIDNLKKIEGVGPKIEELLNDAGITTFVQLSQSKHDTLKTILESAGSRYKMHDPTSWPQQAELAMMGAWDELSKLQDRLVDN